MIKYVALSFGENKPQREIQHGSVALGSFFLSDFFEVQC